MKQVWIALIASTLLCSGTCISVAGSLKSEKDQRVFFRSPTGNLQCTFIPRGNFDYLLGGDGPEIACVRFDPDEAVVVLNGTQAAVARQDEFEWPENVQTLPYGQSFVTPIISCTSGKSGIDCKSKSGHGFRISKTALKTY